MRKPLLTPTFILAINDLTELHTGTQAVFFRRYNFFFWNQRTFPLLHSHHHYTTAPASQHLYRARVATTVFCLSWAFLPFD
ncbi:MAG TPA: hypothetical protein VMX16_11405 [Terriglobia bacterium]|nr:hypothetical protein [Terriglobia bacterium]